LEALIAVCGNGTEQFDMVPGRSGPELGAALFQSEKFFELHPELKQNYVQHKPVKFKDDPGLFPSDAFPELAPYKSLDAKRLKLVGTGAWPMADFLSGPLWLPFQEPRFLLHGLDDDHSVWPALHAEDREENLELAKIWDARGLLRLHKFPLLKDHFSRVFNAFKNSSVDRQIGDRRIPNSRERSIDGPSHHLPPGFILVNMRVEPYEEQLFGSVTDRRDFYHQAKVSSERARSNMLPFSYSADELAGTRALAEVPFDNPRRKPRAVVGDGFGEEDCSGRLHEDAGKWFPCFGSLFQGGHLGVEFALKAHEEVLQRGGLLRPEMRLQGHAIFPEERGLKALLLMIALQLAPSLSPPCPSTPLHLKHLQRLVGSMMLLDCWALQRKTLRQRIFSRQQGQRLCPPMRQ
jgi:hypothetical protein